MLARYRTRIDADLMQEVGKCLPVSAQQIRARSIEVIERRSLEPCGCRSGIVEG
ncbi:hypothetical protein [Novosphingobium mangrovi (ex Huang et al. 2023)]|uniref:Uncharacterized protein n=1 Tax=Novosphingobium mangrovi (ex Huang et al. 2023) TaxID=2976432 RepID=A0ABT2I1M6_9SPHN|nr:hypothetical protein [Novosphingobium mangrovi (ex Huang et al. 2023)]MCT2398548.1 hypothetical protein [Novosphingobium mangrovi (ex Huang et al. 2023)]